MSISSLQSYREALTAFVKQLPDSLARQDVKLRAVEGDAG